MRKYWTDVFSIEEIETCNNMEFDDREIFWIAYYQNFNKKYGYNLTLGGSRSQKYTDEKILKCKKYWCGWCCRNANME